MIRDRIKELRRVRAADLLPHPLNYRTHPPAQQEAMRAALEEIGWADVLIAREDESGRLVLCDGHLRRDLAPDELVPVVVLDVSEAEPEKLLATLDPLTGMAEIDKTVLAELASKVEFESKPLRDLLAANLTESQSPNGTTASILSGLEFRIVVDCADENEQVSLLKRFNEEGLPCRALIS